ncbi:hypothetical protein Hs30E_13010 [Lactococcus hodotermopsidis]|uniref:Uncharacterized protein n=1 Tax=Pseudolactococcus hodotermopsidis TaxID=2709157 RepID=A0A6A0BBJ4_9LACT|nr:hypothetical protein [Lactococcus hodotermopsidis]GFH42750.1 hypothetical protein Hs30E_13010 [Lactococcus hodotermopsidis]
MTLTKITSQGTLNASSTINDVDAVYFSANINTDGSFNFSVVGDNADAIFDTDKKVSTEIKADVNAFISATYEQAQTQRASYTPEAVQTATTD